MISSKPAPYPFDHLTIIVRDELQRLSEQFIDQGFSLTPLTHHNLGSSNRLIMLDTSYIELLGWEAGKPPQRAEIANQAIGLDALVFRTDDAQQTYEQLQAAGFSVTPVQDLSRETNYLGKAVVAKFKTVRFSEQSILGIRMYFCQHLTPEYVWQTPWLSHPNQLDRLSAITLASPDVQKTSNTLCRLLNLHSQDLTQQSNSISLLLPNLQLNIEYRQNIESVHIDSALLRQGSSSPVDFVINADFFNTL